jgi:hypothetical protein
VGQSSNRIECGILGNGTQEHAVEIQEFNDPRPGGLVIEFLAAGLTHQAPEIIDVCLG